MLNAVQFGAGNIGRGFIGQLLFEAGYRTAFIDANEPLVAKLAQSGSYPLHLVGPGADEQLTIGNLSALSASKVEQVTRLIADADLIATAVGVRALPFVAPALAAGINERSRRGGRPVDILLCENQWHVATMMRDLMLPHLDPEARHYFDHGVGLVEAVIGRMVPAPTQDSVSLDPLLVTAEPYKELPIDKKALRAAAPKLPGLIEADNFPAYEARKLFVHNMSHAALAYLGYQKGHTFIWQCASDHEIASTCSLCLDEIQAALVCEYNFASSALRSFSSDLLTRFANKALGDTVARVAADPVRKLRANDRLAGAATLCARRGIRPTAISTVINAALRYDNPEDPAAMEIQALRRRVGDRAALKELSGIECDF